MRLALFVVGAALGGCAAAQPEGTKCAGPDVSATTELVTEPFPDDEIDPSCRAVAGSSSAPDRGTELTSTLVTSRDGAAGALDCGGHAVVLDFTRNELLVLDVGDDVIMNGVFAVGREIVVDGQAFKGVGENADETTVTRSFVVLERTGDVGATTHECITVAADHPI